VGDNRAGDIGQRDRAFDALDFKLALNPLYGYRPITVSRSRFVRNGTSMVNSTDRGGVSTSMLSVKTSGS
jgi:hypothetical protein